jgi:hypothetical protein
MAGSRKATPFEIAGSRDAAVAHSALARGGGGGIKINFFTAIVKNLQRTLMA